VVYGSCSSYQTPRLIKSSSKGLQEKSSPFSVLLRLPDAAFFLIYAAPYKKSESTKRLLISRYSPKQFKVSGCCSYLKIMDVVMEMNNSVK